MKTFNLIAIMLYWFAFQIEKALSFVASVLTDAVQHFDNYKLPIYNEPTIAGMIKPPTAC